MMIVLQILRDFIFTFLLLGTTGATYFTDILKANEEASKEIPGGLFVQEGEYAPERYLLDKNDSYIKLYDGDIIYTTEIQHMLEGISLYEAKPNAQWTNGVIPYTIDPHDRHHHKMIETINAATGEYHKHLKGCITWKEYPSEEAIKSAGIENYIVFFHGHACFSGVGMLGGKQKLSLGPRCYIKGIAMHEMMHALGFWHEHARKDRDKTVSIVWGNVKKRSIHSFQVKDQGLTLGEPYDIDSIMQYHPKAFSKNRQITIVDKKGKNRFGQRRDFSPTDLKQIRKFYKCDLDVPPPPDEKKVEVKVTHQRPSKVHHKRPSKVHHKPQPHHEKPRDHHQVKKIAYIGDPIYTKKDTRSPRYFFKPRKPRKPRVKITPAPLVIKGIDIRRINFVKKTKKTKRRPINGNWAEWSEYTECTKTCGGGTKRKVRKCDNPKAQYGGRWCVGINVYRTYCNPQSCVKKVHGRYSQWSDWGKCTKKCGGGTMRRSRVCDSPKPANGGRWCLGPRTETSPCNTQPCPEDGGFGAWSNFTRCSRTCDGGVKIRFRKCDNPPPKYGGKYCTGEHYETTACGLKLCEAVCIDRHPLCRTWKKDCNRVVLQVYMQQICSKSCGFCYILK